jgi:hypothetical protein
LGDGLSFQIEQCLLENNICASRIAWGSDTITRTADEILRATEEDASRPAQAEGEEFLQSFLSGGARAFTEIEEEVKAAGLAMRTVRRAKDALNIRVFKAKAGDGLETGHWYWRLDGQQDGQTPTRGHLGRLGHVTALGGQS